MIYLYILVFALMAIPYGLSSAIITVIIPYRMRAAGHPVEEIGLFFSLLMAPAYLQFLYSPIADWRYSKRTWIVISAIVCAVCFALPEYWVSSHPYTPLILAVVLLGQIASGILMTSVSSLVVLFFTGAARARAASWEWAGSVLGSLLGAELALRPTDGSSTLSNALCFGLLSILPGLLVLLIKPIKPPPTPSTDSQRLLGDELQHMRQDPRFWITLLLSISPSCAAGLMGLFSALAPDFHASASHVAMANGTVGSLTMVLGTMLAGCLSMKADRRTLYVACSASLSMVATSMAFLPHSSSIYLGGVLIYSFICGISYGLFNAMVIELLDGNPRYAATKYSFFLSISNLPVAYVAFIDSRLHHQFGARSVFLTDALFNIAGIAMWALLWRQLQQRQSAQSPAPAPALAD